MANQRRRLRLTQPTRPRPFRTGTDDAAPKPRGFDTRLLALPMPTAVVLFGGYFGYKYFAPTKQIESIAVMPFVNESGNADVEYLSDGMTERL